MIDNTKFKTNKETEKKDQKNFTNEMVKITS